MTRTHRFLRPSRTERTIAAARMVLGASSLFALWLDPAEPARYVVATYSLQVLYVMYSVVLARVMWNRPSSGRLPLATHIVDIVLFSIFQYMTLGPSSPFFTYFVFSLFCGALRWGWRGTLGTAVAVLVAYLGMGASMSRTLGPTEFELNRFIIRTVYLAVSAGLLVYLGQHEVRLRSEIERLARWPTAPGGEPAAVMRRVLAHAAQIMGAGRAMVMWEAGEEPWVQLASWSPSAVVVSKHGPEEFEPPIPADIKDAVILCTTDVTGASVALVHRQDVSFERPGLPIHPLLLAHLGGAGLASAPFQTERVSGRVFFSDLADATAELIALTEVLAREIGASIDQLHVTDQLRAMAAREQRIRVARDLHDGVLQSLTGIRFELQTVADTLGTNPAERARERLLGIERALAIEQRELRRFIDDLRPDVRHAAGVVLVDRLHALEERLRLEWQVPVTIRIDPGLSPMPEPIEDAVPLMVHEAVVNALKHAQPSRVSVDVTSTDHVLRIVVSDDGRGFPFRGQYDHMTLMRSKLGPTSLLERASSLGGEMKIESLPTGSRVEIAVPVTTGGV